MNKFLTISSAILIALSCVTTSDARSHDNRRKPDQIEYYYYHPDFNSERSQSTKRGLDNCTVWGHYIYPCE